MEHKIEEIKNSEMQSQKNKGQNVIHEVSLLKICFGYSACAQNKV